MKQEGGLGEGAQHPPQKKTSAYIMLLASLSPCFAVLDVISLGIFPYYIMFRCCLHNAGKIWQDIECGISLNGICSILASKYLTGVCSPVLNCVGSYWIVSFLNTSVVCLFFLISDYCCTVGTIVAAFCQ